jgi:hypothetical protein
MKRFLLIVSLINFSILTNAQNLQQSGAPNTGRFFVTITTAKGQEQMNVNYTLMPGIFTTEVTLNMDCWDRLLLSAKIFNSRNEAVSGWMPPRAEKMYSHQFDISNLTPGVYSIVIYGPTGKEVHTLNFEKHASTN